MDRSWFLIKIKKLYFYTNKKKEQSSYANRGIPKLFFFFYQITNSFFPVHKAKNYYKLFASAKAYKEHNTAVELAKAPSVKQFIYNQVYKAIESRI